MTEERELPKGWTASNLGEFVSETGQSINPAKFSDEEFELYSIPSFETGKPEIVKGKLIGSMKQVVEPDSVLISKINPRINRCWKVLSLSQHRKVASTEWIVFPPHPAVEPDYLRYYMSQDIFRKFLALNVSGVGGSLMRVRSSTLSPYVFRVAPAAEQRRIVDKIEELFSLIEAGEGAVERARQLLERYRQWVLNGAVTGALTKDWREQHKGEIESGEALLKRILKARREAWEKAELAKLQARGKPPADDRWKQKYKEPELPDKSDLPKLPEGWIWVTWSSVGFCQNGRAFPSSEYRLSGRRLLRPGNLHLSGRIVWTKRNSAFLDESWHNSNLDLLLRSGDIVMNLTAQSLAEDFLGRVCMLGDGDEALLNQRLARIQPVHINDRYCFILLRSRIFRTFVESWLNTGSLIQHMFTSQVEKFIFSLPSSGEQSHIVSKIDAALSNLDRLEEAVVLEDNHAASLRQSILAAAFAGKLVPQDLADEPAAVLLDRIRAGRAAAVGGGGPAHAARRRGRPRRTSGPELPLVEPEVTAALGQADPGDLDREAR